MTLAIALVVTLIAAALAYLAGVRGCALAALSAVVFVSGIIGHSLCVASARSEYPDDRG